MARSHAKSRGSHSIGPILALLLLVAISTPSWVSASAQLSSFPVWQNLPDAPSHVASGDIEPGGQETAPIPKQDSDCTAKVPVNPPPAVEGDRPNPAAGYEPLSSHCKFELFLRQTYSPYTFASVAYEATWAQAFAQWPQYGGGMQGWGKRLAATLADTESRRFIQGYVYSTILHQDPRYFPSGKKALVDRAWYAASRVLITRSDGGGNVLNTSELFGALTTSSVQDAYYPRPYRTFGNTMNRFGGALSSDATSHILDEFTPDLKRFYHAHAPRKIQDLVGKCPIVGKEAQ
jgi:hypothetical protein